MPVYTNEPDIRVDYKKLLDILRKKRMTLSAFAKNCGLSRADVYCIRVDEMMSIEGEFRACHYLNCDVSDIRNVYPIDPNDPNFQEPIYIKQ